MNFGSEDPGLLVGALRQLTAAHAAREAQIVANQRAVRGLSAEPGLINDEGAEPFRGAIDRGRQSSGPTADDHEVELHALGVDRRARGAGEVGVRRVPQDGPIRKGDQRKWSPLAGLCDDVLPNVGVRETERVWERATHERLPQFVRPTRPRLTDDDDCVR